MSLIDPKSELWFVTGSQHLYGPEALKQGDIDSEKIARAPDAEGRNPIKVVFKPVATTPDQKIKNPDKP